MKMFGKGYLFGSPVIDGAVTAVVLVAAAFVVFPLFAWLTEWSVYLFSCLPRPPH